MSLILKFTLALAFWGIFAYVIFQVEYPKSLTQASLLQILAFFIPLFLALSFSFNLVLNLSPISFFLSFGLILLLILKALDALNLVTAGLTLLAVYLFVSYFQKQKKKSLTSSMKIPKLKSLRR
ncbi:hypothetical protein HY386_01205 [Candidatus Daviesbacteria bacterium]|nr:hypothetical protein [Candidatus Daviesbacteria bacterium]